MRNTWIWTALVLAAIVGGSYGLYVFLQPRPFPEELLYGNGHIEATEIRVPAEVAGPVVESRLAEGERVELGDLLVRIDEADFVLQRERAVAEVEALRRQRERAERELRVARHHLDTAERDLDRYRELRERSDAPPQRLEQAEDAFQQARGNVAVLDSEIQVFDARLDAARKDLALVERRIAKTRVTAPIGGTVLAKAVEAGEYLRPASLVAILADLSRVDLKVFIPESEIGKLPLDADVRVRVDAFPNRLFEGRVARVDQQAQFTPRDIHMPQERTRMVFGVTVAVANSDRLLKPGMPADAWILWRRDSGWPDQLFVPE